MGACGCMEDGPHYKLPAPKGKIYGITIFSGCTYCDTGPGLIISEHTKAQAKEFGYDLLPDLPMNNGAFGGPDVNDFQLHDCAIPIGPSVGDMTSECLKWASTIEDNGGAEYWVDQMIEDVLPEMYGKTIQRSFENSNEAF